MQADDKEVVSSGVVSSAVKPPPQADDGGNETTRPPPPHHHHRPHRQWLIDRTLGTSQVSENDNNDDDEARRAGDDGRPPLPCCWVPACVGRCPRVLEQNCFCECMGSIGFKKALGENRVRRRRIMMVSAIFNAVGFVLTLLSCLAMSTNYGVLTAFSFTNGRIQDSVVGTTSNNNANATTNENNNSLEFRPINMALGLRAVATENMRSFRYNETGQDVYTFDEFCDFPQQAIASAYFPTDKCKSCRDVSSTLMISLGISLLAYIPSMSTSFSRMYYNYDVNCRKTLAIFTTALSFCLALKTIIGYKNNCYSAFYDVQIPLDLQDREVVAQQDASNSTQEGVVTVSMEWNGGVGLLCLVVAMVLKILELTLHLILPSPSIARSRHEQAAYESKRQNKSTFNGDEENVNTSVKDPSTVMAQGCAENGDEAGQQQEPLQSITVGKVCDE
jgi:multidrug transporter EmrE-like cation transporter